MKNLSQHLEKSMEKTGERYNPEDNYPSNAYEHWHRYFFASQFVKGRDVLDIACGEGYGSNLLCNTASTVTGVDISEEAINFARKKYVHNNLRYMLGDAKSIPIHEDRIFDIVVSFETIEHLSANSQDLYIQEIKRLLKPDGMLIVSTPNKAIYSDLSHSKNIYHLREFYLAEFIEFLKGKFEHVQMMGQKLITSSYIGNLFVDNRAIQKFVYDFENRSLSPLGKTLDFRYFIAVCSDKEISNSDASIFLDQSGLLDKNIDDLLRQSQELQFLKTSRYWALVHNLRRILIKFLPHRGPA